MPGTSPPRTGKQREMAGLRRKGYFISIGAKKEKKVHFGMALDMDMFAFVLSLLS